LPCYGAVHDDLVPRDIPEDALVSGGRAATVVLRRQAIDGNDQMKVRERAPFRWDRTDGAGNQLYLDAKSRELRQQDSEFAVTDERFSAHDGKVQRPQAPNQA